MQVVTIQENDFNIETNNLKGIHHKMIDAMASLKSGRADDARILLQDAMVLTRYTRKYRKGGERVEHKKPKHLMSDFSMTRLQRAFGEI